MKKILCILLISLSPIFIFGSKGEVAYSIETVPNVYATDRRMHVSDPNAILSASTSAEINRMLTLLEDSTGIQSLVVMLPSIGNEDIFDFSHNLFRHLGIGNKESNNGLLVLYVADQRKIRFTTGYGLEGYLPDAICKRIQTRHMIPYFREGNTDLGMLEGTKAIVSVLDGSMQADSEEEDISLLTLLLVVGISILLIAIPIWLAHRQASTCPKCGKVGRLKVVAQTSYRDAFRRKFIRQTLICSSCGHTLHRDHQDHDHDAGSIAGGMLMGSMLGGGRRMGGGGGFSGGSFGGGSTGGGGSTSGW